MFGATWRKGRGAADAELDPQGAARASIRRGADRVGVYGLNRSRNRVVVGRHRRRRAGDPVRQLCHAGLGDDDGAGLAQVLRDRRLVGRHESGERQRTAGGRQVGRVNVVFQCNGDPVKGSARPSRSPPPVAVVRLLERVGIHRKARVRLSS